MMATGEMMTTRTQAEVEISAQEAALLLKKHVLTVQKMCRQKRLRARKIGGEGPWFIRLSSVVPPKPDEPAPTTTPPDPKPPAG